MNSLESMCGESGPLFFYLFHKSTSPPQHAEKTTQRKMNRVSGQLKTFAKLNVEVNAEVKPIQGLYHKDTQDGEFYNLLARVLLARFSEKGQAKGEQE